MAQLFLPEEPLFALDGGALLLVEPLIFWCLWLLLTQEDGVVCVLESDHLLQQDPSQRIATKCHICHFREGELEKSSSKFGVTWRQGNRKSLQKDIVDFIFFTKEALFQIAQYKKSSGHPLQYT